MIERRIGLLFASFLLLLVLGIGRAAWVQGVQGGGLTADAQSQQMQTVPVPGLRGSILDRKGRELAVSEDAVDVIATPYQVKDPPQMARKLAPILHISKHDILKNLDSGSSGFAYLARDADLTAAGRIRKLGLTGVTTVPASRRVYPEGKLAGQVIGTVGVDGQGLTGLEAADNTIVGATNGEQRVVLDGLGKAIERNTISTATDGQNIKLTLDAAIQARTEDVLANVAQTYQPLGATAIVMNPRNAQILAMANWPTVDPSNPAGASPQALQNMATGFTYEPGSTFKAFTVAGALMEHLVTPSTVFDLPVELQVADRTISDAEPRGPESLTVAQILAQSSNVGAVKIGLEVGAQHFYDWVRKFGFGQPTGVAFPGEEQGIVPTPSEFSGSTMGNLPIGQGLSVTPMQMAAAYSAIADGGILRAPQLVLDEDGHRVAEPKGHRIISSKSAAQIRTMLEGVLAPGGTASEVSVPGYTLAGKTGTAQVAENGTYSETKFVASFVGFAPAQDPKLLVAIVVNQPTQGSYYGGTVAAPAFGEIAKFALPYLGIPPDQGTSP
ncbi:MAG TPA: penicillin-binding protein 2 [Solirubrobacterales bacterium]|nr:penicillin-binding protein 2 [Solirubrobacterales bacterium]